MAARVPAHSADDGAPPPGSPRAWLETILVTALIPGLCLAMGSRDPFCLEGFPWVLLAPLVIGLQHGLRFALVSGLSLIVAASGLFWAARPAIGSFPSAYPISVGLIAIVAGGCRDRWQRALEESARESGDLGHRVQRLARSYHLLRRSHDDLEQRVASSGPGLKVICDRVYNRLRRSGASTLAEAGQCILESFACHGQVRAASLHAVVPAREPGSSPFVDRDGEDRVVGEPIAVLGTIPPLAVDHPMVRGAVSARRIASVREHRHDAPGPLVCVPLADSSGCARGVILVYELPFIAMREDHIARLAALGQRVGEWLAECRDPGDVSLAARRT